jgi:hypothetical protein
MEVVLFAPTHPNIRKNCVRVEPGNPYDTKDGKSFVTTNGHQYVHKANKPTESVLERQRAVLFNDYSNDWDTSYWTRLGMQLPTTKLGMYKDLVRNSTKVKAKKALKTGRAKIKKDRKKEAAAVTLARAATGYCSILP